MRGFTIITVATQHLVSRIPKDDIQKITAVLIHHSYAFERFSIDDARQIRTILAGHRSHELTYYVLQIDRFSDDAQQSLLKILEELPEHLGLIICIPAGVVLLDTVISRAIQQLHAHHDSEIQDFSEKTFEGMYKKDPEAHRRHAELFGLSLLGSIEAKGASAVGLAKYYQNVLNLVNELQEATSVKQIVDYFQMIHVFLRKNT